VKLGQLLGLPTSVTLFAMIAMTCAFVDLLISHNEKEAIRLALLKGWFFLDRSHPESALRRAANSILNVFDVIYGKRHFSWRCFGMAAPLSVIFVLTVGLLFSRNISRHYDGRYNHPVAASILAAACFNIPSDFISILKARWILNTARRRHGVGVLLPLLMDFIASYVICVLVFIAIFIAARFIMIDPPLSLPGSNLLGIIAVFLKIAVEYVFEAIRSLVWSTTENGHPPLFGLSFLSTFATSWVFLMYTMMAFTIPTASRVRSRMMYLLENLFDTKALFTTIGALISGIILILNAIFYLVGGTQP
jgi:hypothetical protein